MGLPNDCRDRHGDPVYRHGVVVLRPVTCEGVVHGAIASDPVRDPKDHRRESIVVRHDPVEDVGVHLRGEGVNGLLLPELEP